MNVVITGGAGFLGGRLARELLATGELSVAGAGRRELTRLTLADRVPVPPDVAADPRVSVVTGDLTELLSSSLSTPDLLTGADVVFHLAAAVSGECEADFDLGLRANLAVTEALLAGCRAACPVDPGTEVALASPAKAIAGLLRAAAATDEEWAA